MKLFSKLPNYCLLILLAQRLWGDEGNAISKVESLGGQVLGIAQNTEGIRVLIPPKTFEGRVLVDDDLAVLSDFKNLVELDLKNAGITDAGLVHLSNLTDLERLHLEKTKITDAGLPHLKALTKLRYLNLYGTSVSDSGLPHLKSLTALQNLYLWQTKVSFEAAQKFHETQRKAGNDRLEINLGWDKEILSATRLAFLKEQRAQLNAEDNAEESNESNQSNESNESSALVDPDFKTHILPIFKKHCTQCHGDEKQKEDLRLDTYEYALKGGEHGAVIVAEDLIGSRLFQRITLPADDDDIMPPKGDPLSDREIAIIKNWIVNGAKASQPKVAKVVSEASSVFVEYVLPIFKSACVDCHGEDKQKAGLRLDSISFVLKGSDEGAVIKPRDPVESALFRRITLPADDEDIMPPKGDPLSKAQTDLIKLWIISGAK